MALGEGEEEKKRTVWQVIVNLDVDCTIYY